MASLKVMEALAIFLPTQIDALWTRAKSFLGIDEGDAKNDA